MQLLCMMEHCDLELAVEVRQGSEEGGKRKEGEGGQVDIKSNNPHQTGGEQASNWTLRFNDST